LEQNSDIEEWPSSPNLSPIENVWAYIKDELYKVRVRLHTKEDVWRESVRIWMSDKLDEVIMHLYHTMPNRIEELIAKRGNPINY